MNALGTLGKLAQKPSDKKIRLTRVVFALILIAAIVFGWNATDVNVSFFDNAFYDLPDYLVAILFVFPAIGLVRGIIDPGIFRKAIWKRVITSLGIAMMLISIFFISEKTPEAPVIEPGKVLTQEEIANADSQSDNFSLPWTDTLFALFGFFVTFTGFFLNGKNLTTKNEKYGEVIKKIRV